MPEYAEVEAHRRLADEPCPRGGTPMQRIEVAGRTTYVRPEHQR